MKTKSLLARDEGFGDFYMSVVTTSVMTTKSLVLAHRSEKWQSSPPAYIPRGIMPTETHLSESDELATYNNLIEVRREELLEGTRPDREEIASEIKRLQSKVAAMLRAKADVTLKPLQSAHNRAVAEARRLLGK